MLTGVLLLHCGLCWGLCWAWVRGVLYCLLLLCLPCKQRLELLVCTEDV